jgi:hypothetical protein
MILPLADRVAAAFHDGGDTYLAARSAVHTFSGLAAAAFALLALAVLRRPWPAAAATLVYAGLFGAWIRSINNYLREDFALPGLLLATAAVVELLFGGTGRRLRVAAIAGALIGALWAGSAWHMSQFYLALLGLLIVLTGLVGRLREAALAGGALWAGMALAAVSQQALWVKGALWNVGSALTLAPVVAFVLTRTLRREGRQRRVLAAVAVVLGGAAALAGSSADYAHVRSLVLAKLLHLGRRPEPAALSPDARLFWVGPFESPDALDLYLDYGFVTLLVAIGLVLVARAALRERSPRLGFAALAVLGSGLLFALMQRMTVFFAPWAALAAVLAVTRTPLPALRFSLGVVLLAASGLNVYGGLHHFDVGGRYHRTVEELFAPAAPPTWTYGSEQEQLLARLRAAPPGALLTDFSTSAALLYETGRPIALHPMFEVAAIRPKTLEYAGAMLGDEDDLLALCERWDARYVIHYAIQVLGRAPGSIYRLTGQEPVPGSVAHAMQFAPESLQRFRLVYESYSVRVFAVGAGYDGYRARARHPLFDPEVFARVPTGSELEEAFARIHAAQRHYLDGLAGEQLGDLPRAATGFGNALFLHPDFEDANLRFGAACLALGDFPRAREALARAAELDPADPRPRDLLARIPSGR